MPPAHPPQRAALPDALPAVGQGAVDDFVRAGGVVGKEGREEVFAGDGEGVALGGADEVVGRVVCRRRGRGGGGSGGGDQGEALLGVCGDDGAEFGEGDVEGAEAGPGELFMRGGSWLGWS